MLSEQISPCTFVYLNSNRISNPNIISIWCASGWTLPLRKPPYSNDKKKNKKKKSQEIHSTFRDSFLANFSVGEELSFSKPMNIFDSDYTREVGRQDWSRIEVSVSETEQAEREIRSYTSTTTGHHGSTVPLPLTSMFRLTSPVIMLAWKRSHL